MTSCFRIATFFLSTLWLSSGCRQLESPAVVYGSSAGTSTPVGSAVVKGGMLPPSMDGLRLAGEDSQGCRHEWAFGERSYRYWRTRQGLRKGRPEQGRYSYARTGAGEAVLVMSGRGPLRLGLRDGKTVVAKFDDQEATIVMSAMGVIPVTDR